MAPDDLIRQNGFSRGSLHQVEGEEERDVGRRASCGTSLRAPGREKATIIFAENGITDPPPSVRSLNAIRM